MVQYMLGHHRYTLLVCLAASLVVNFAPNANANLRLISDPPSVIHKGPGVPFDVDIRVQGAVPYDRLKSFEIVLDYDPTALEVLAVKEGELFANSGYPTFWYLYEDELEEGKIHVVDAILGYGLDVKASGVLFTITFRGRSQNWTVVNFEVNKVGVLNEQMKVVYVPEPQLETIEIALPVGFFHFTALVGRYGVILEWQVEEVQTPLGFTVYRRLGGEEAFHPLNSVPILGRSGGGERDKYRFIDDTAESGKVYEYFIEITNVLGQHARSQVLTVRVRPQGTTWGELKRRWMP